MKDYAYTEQHQMIMENMKARGIEVIDLADAFGERNPNDLVAHVLDRHYSAEGSRLIAEAMARHLRERLEKYSNP